MTRYFLPKCPRYNNVLFVRIWDSTQSRAVAPVNPRFKAAGGPLSRSPGLNPPLPAPYLSTRLCVAVADLPGHPTLAAAGRVFVWCRAAFPHSRPHLKLDDP